MGNILFVTPVRPDADGGGRAKRACQWMHELSQQGDVHLLVVAERSPGGTGRFLSWRSAAERLGWRSPDRGDRDALEREYATRRFDRIVCFRLYLLDYARHVRRLTACPVLEADLDDIESATRWSISKLSWKTGRWKKGLLMALSAAYFRWEEFRAADGLDGLYVCSAEDGHAMGRRFPSLRVGVMPNRVAGAPARPLPRPPQHRRRLLFIGTLDYYPNEEAIRWFVRHVLPPLRRRQPDWTLLVAGFGGDRALEADLGAAAGVCYLGRVDQAEEAYRHASIVIAPLHAGGGTKLKVLEAAAYGRPVVATAEAVRGLGLRRDKHYLHAETAEQFASACETIADDDRRYDALVREARRYAEHFFIYGYGGDTVV